MISRHRDSLAHRIGLESTETIITGSLFWRGTGRKTAGADSRSSIVEPDRV